MALPIRGIWASRYAQPSATPQIWGTGINPVHYVYGSPAARLSPIRPMDNMPGIEHDHTPPYEGVPDTGHYAFTTLPDTAEGIYYDDRQAWDVPPEDSVARYSSQGMLSYNASGSAKNTFRSIWGGAGRTFRGKRPRADYQIPTETVSEGWLNKPNEGEIAVSKPSDPEQYERQTSMQQRFQARNNILSQLRGTDALRHAINSRVQRQRSPVYSGEERHYDMYPQQQTPERERIFYYRTAGTGKQQWMEDNQLWEISAVQRTPPPDPYIGPTEAQIEFGYTTEDYFYA